MKTVKISLDSIEKVKSFVNTIARFDADFDLVSGRYVIDAKSIMGIFQPGSLEANQSEHPRKRFDGQYRRGAEALYCRVSSV